MNMIGINDELTCLRSQYPEFEWLLDHEDATVLHDAWRFVTMMFALRAFSHFLFNPSDHSPTLRSSVSSCVTRTAGGRRARCFDEEIGVIIRRDTPIVPMYGR